MSFSQIRYEVENAVCTVTLNRPDQLNAVTSTMLGELREAWDRADADDAVRAVIVTGAGRAFCAGADLGAGGATFDASARGLATSAEDHRDGGGDARDRPAPTQQVEAAPGPAAPSMTIGSPTLVTRANTGCATRIIYAS